MGIQSDNILIEQFISDHPVEAVHLIENLKDGEIIQILDTLPDLSSTQVIAQMNMVTAINCLQSMPKGKAVAIIENLPMEFVSVLTRNFPGDLQKEILNSISKEKSIFLNRTLTYPEGTVGSIMEPFVYTFFEDMVVSDVIGILKNQSEKNEIYIYIVARNHKISGVITVSELLRAKSSLSLGTIMKPKVTKIFADIKLNLISDHPGWQEYPVLPVVDNNDILQGVLKYKILRRFEEGHTKKRVPQHLIKASGALGELYRIGMTSLIQGASTLYNQPEK